MILWFYDSKTKMEMVTFPYTSPPKPSAYTNLQQQCHKKVSLLQFSASGWAQEEPGTDELQG